jgi:shikimate kinase
MNINNIILIGFMGTGKTSIGRKTAEILGMNFIDTDLLIEETTGMSISKIFKHHGESFFRQQELEVALKVSEYMNCVVATGGGMVTVSNCMESLRKNGIIIWLKMPFKNIMDRIKKDVTRPLAHGKNEKQLEDMFETRLQLYDKYCDKSVDLSGKTINQAASEIADLYEKTRINLFKKKEI